VNFRRYDLPCGLCPLYPQKRTLELSREMSALCQKQTLVERVGMSALCQKQTFAVSIDHLAALSQGAASFTWIGSGMRLSAIESAIGRRTF
jgi:hypothetical protein